MKEIKGQRQHFESVFLYIFIVLALAIQGCATSSTREILQNKQDKNRAHRAAYAADGFTLDHRSPDSRPNRAWEFYFKNCSLVSRNPYPNKAEFACSDPY